MRWEWAIGELLVLAILVREWFSIRRELARDRAARARAGTADADDDENAAAAGVDAPSGAAGHAEGQHELDQRDAETRQ
ncbi:MAG: hypothetical protein RLW61_00400 [Gammaproteobacteria bacterium]|jgi:hypothetical protein